MTGKFIEYPFDTIKVRLQTSSPNSAHSFNGPLDCLRQTIRSEGFFGLYAGLSSPLFGAMVENALLFSCYSRIQNVIRRISPTNSNNSDSGGSGGELTLPQLAASGAAAGAIVSFVLTPIELVKCKLQVAALGIGSASGNGTAYTGPFQVIRDVYQQNGLKGFFRGQMGTLIRETGGGAAWFGTYEAVCHLFVERARREQLSQQFAADEDVPVITKDSLSAGSLMTAGACAGMVFNLLFYPADVIKSRMQVFADSANGRKVGFVQTGLDVWRSGGFKTVYRGCGITVARSAPANAAIFATYEYLSRFY
ncbi:mitochondrial ornithine carrier protein, partial [Ramicandelaber brevisporus]